MGLSFRMIRFRHCDPACMRSRWRAAKVDRQRLLLRQVDMWGGRPACMPAKRGARSAVCFEVSEKGFPIVFFPAVGHAGMVVVGDVYVDEVDSAAGAVLGEG